jgi:hypothetical protein
MGEEKLGSCWKSRQDRAYELISKGATIKWRMLLIATSVLLGIDPLRAAAREVPEAWRVETSQACSPTIDGLSGPFEVLIFRDKNFGTQCASLRPGLYPYDWTMATL